LTEETDDGTGGWSSGSRVQITSGEYSGGVGILVGPAGKKGRWRVQLKGIGHVTFREKRLSLVNKRLSKHTFRDPHENDGKLLCACGRYADAVAQCFCKVSICDKCRRSFCKICEQYMCRSCDRIKNVCSVCTTSCKRCRKEWTICPSCRHDLCHCCGAFQLCEGVCQEKICFRCRHDICLNCKYVQESHADELKETLVLAPNAVPVETFKQPVIGQAHTVVMPTATQVLLQPQAQSLAPPPPPPPPPPVRTVESAAQS